MFFVLLHIEKAVKISHKNTITTLPEALSVIADKDEKIDFMAARIAQLERLLFGQKRERFEHPNNQLTLPFELDAKLVEIQEEQLEEKRKTIAEHERKTSHKGRLPLPEHLEVVETIIEPEIDTTEMVCVGEEITEELGYQPEKFFIHRIIRKKYAPKSGEGSFAIAILPERVIEKGIPSVELVTQILVDKYIDHLPIYRIKQRFARNKIDLKNSTLIGWVSQSLTKLEILYEHLKNQIVAKGYLQVDETTLKVQDSTLKGIGSPNRTHLGYYWAYNSTIDNILFFEYHQGRAAKHVNKTLKDFTGYLQTDGYAGYNGLAQKESIVHVGCMAHARRKFDEAKANDILRAEKALLFFQVLYQIESKARQQSLEEAARKELRLTESLPVLNELGKWMVEENKKVLPKSKIGMAFHYCIERWDALTAYLNDGNLEIDNNLIENAIRPIALGRKNYLFAGSHEAAQRSAIIYTFFGICKKHNINPTNWLNYVFKNIQSTKISELDKLLPQNFGKS